MNNRNMNEKVPLISKIVYGFGDVGCNFSRVTGGEFEKTFAAAGKADYNELVRRLHKSCYNSRTRLWRYNWRQRCRNRKKIKL